MRPKTPIKTPKGQLDVPHSQVVRMSDRLHRMSSEQRQGAVERAEARLKGKHPRRRDAAIKAASA